MNKKCMKCGKPASHKFVRIENNQIYDLYYCEEHAQESSPYQKPKIPLSQILATLIGQEQAAQISGQAIEEDARCRTCGLAFGAYRKTLILGCPDCYESFYSQLLPELRKLHGNIKHIGRKPGGGKETSEGRGYIVPVEQAAGALPVKEPVKLLSPPEPEEETEDDPDDPVKRIESLKKELAKAIESEDFERAAECRDSIKELQESLKH